MKLNKKGIIWVSKECRDIKIPGAELKVIKEADDRRFGQEEN